MKLIAGILYLEFKEAIASGIAHRTALRLKTMSDPDDKRHALIQYSTLAQKYQDLITGHFGDPFKYHAISNLEAFMPVDEQSRKFLNDFRLPDGTALPKQKIDQYISACSVLKFLSKCDKSTVKKLGYDRTETVYNAVFDIINHRDLPLPASYSNLKKKIRAFNADGAKAIISQKFGNSNSQKLTEDIKDYLLHIYSDPKKPTVEKVALMYRQQATAKGWPKVANSTIYQYLMQPAIQQIWYRYRHGDTTISKTWKDTFGYSISKNRPQFSNSKWESDGTKLNLWYLGHDGQVEAYLMVYLVIDVFSEVILGYNVSESESHIDVYKAFRAAVNTSGVKPYQVLYDNSSANRSAATREFFNRISHVDFPAQPYNGQSKIVESVILRLQKDYLKDFDNFTGQNITAKREDSKANTEWMKKNKHTLPNARGVVEQLSKAIKAYNHTKLKSGLTRMELYQSSENPEAHKITMLDMVEIFWLWRENPVTYRKDGLTLTVNNNKVKYEVVNAEGLPDSDFIEQHILDGFQIKYDPWNMDAVRLYKDDKFVAEAQVKQLMPSAIQDYEEGDRSRIQSRLNVRKEQTRRIDEKIDKVRKKAKAENYLKLSFDNVHKDALNRAEGDVLVEEIIDDRRTDIFRDDNTNEGKIIEDGE